MAELSEKGSLFLPRMQSTSPGSQSRTLRLSQVDWVWIAGWVFQVLGLQRRGGRRPHSGEGTQFSGKGLDLERWGREAGRSRVFLQVGTES